MCAAPSATRRVDRIAPHITLVPPVNVAERDLPRAFTVVRTAASTIAPLTLADRAGGHLRAGEPGRLPPGGRRAAGARGVRAAADRRASRARSSGRPSTSSSPTSPSPTSWPRTASTRSLRLLVGLLGARRPSTGCTCSPSCPGRVWKPVADAPLGERPAVVGRGSLPLELTVTGPPRRGGRRAAVLRGGDARACRSPSPLGATTRSWRRRGAGRRAARSRWPTWSSPPSTGARGSAATSWPRVVALARRRDCELVGAGAPAVAAAEPPCWPPPGSGSSTAPPTGARRWELSLAPSGADGVDS